MGKKRSRKKTITSKKNNRLNPPTKSCLSPYYDPDSINKQKGSLFERYYRIRNDNYNSVRNEIQLL